MHDDILPQGCRSAWSATFPVQADALIPAIFTTSDLALTSSSAQWQLMTLHEGRCIYICDECLCQASTGRRLFGLLDLNAVCQGSVPSPRRWKALSSTCWH